MFSNRYCYQDFVWLLWLILWWQMISKSSGINPLSQDLRGLSCQHYLRDRRMILSLISSWRHPQTVWLWVIRWETAARTFEILFMTHKLYRILYELCLLHRLIDKTLILGFPVLTHRLLLLIISVDFGTKSIEQLALMIIVLIGLGGMTLAFIACHRLFKDFWITLEVARRVTLRVGMQVSLWVTTWQGCFRLLWLGPLIVAL